MWLRVETAPACSTFFRGRGRRPKFAAYVGRPNKDLFELWQTGPMKPITKYGGLPKPTGCV